MRKKKLMTQAFAGMLVTALVLQSTPMAATHAQAAQKVVIKTQKQLDAALKNKKVASIEIRTKNGTTFSIKRGTYNKSVVVDATKAKVVNNGKFKSVTVKNAASYTEKADNNKINITDKKLDLTVSKGADNSKITVSGTGSKINVKANGKVASVTANKKTTLKVTGSTSKTIKITSNAKGANVTVGTKANVQFNKYSVLNVVKGGQVGTVKAKSDLKANVAKGGKITTIDSYGENAKVNVKADGTVAKLNVNKKADVNVEGDTKTAVKVTSKAENTTFVIDAKSDLVLTEAANVTVTDGTVVENLVAGKDANVTVEKGAIVKNVTVQGTDAKVNVEANGTVENVAVDAKATVTVTGETTIPVKVTANTEGAKIDTAVKTEVTANANVAVTVQKGAEGSTVTSTKEDVKPTVENKTEEKVTTTDSKGEATEVKPGETINPTEPSKPAEPSKPSEPSTLAPGGSGGSTGGGGSSTSGGNGSTTTLKEYDVYIGHGDASGNMFTVDTDATGLTKESFVLKKGTETVEITSVTESEGGYAVTAKTLEAGTYTLTIKGDGKKYKDTVKTFTLESADQIAVNTVADAVKKASFTNVGYNSSEATESNTEDALKLAALKAKVEAMKGETTVDVVGTEAGTYTVTITKGEANATVTITATFADTNTTEGKLAVAKEALTWDSIKSSNTEMSGVTSDLTLLTKGENDTTITWTSSNDSVVATSGTVTRPESNEEDVQVTLTATFSYTAPAAANVPALARSIVSLANTVESNPASVTKEFTVTVKRKDVTTPSISTDLSDGEVSYTIGAENVTELSVTADSVAGHETLSYQWYKATDVELNDATPITDATENSYTPSANAAGTTYYYVVVTNTVNEHSDRTATVKSKAAKITVNKKTGVEIPENTTVSAAENGVDTNKVTLTEIAVEGSTVEYAVSKSVDASDLTWQDSNVFEGLEAGTNYYFYARTKETADTQAGTPKLSGAIRTKDAPVTSVTINAEKGVKVGETLTAISDGTGTLTYQWMRSAETGYENITNATSQSYKLKKDDVGKTIKVSVKQGDSDATESDATAAVAKGDVTISVAPTLSEVQEVGTVFTSITLTPGTANCGGETVTGTFALTAEPDDESEKITTSGKYTYTFTPSGDDANAYNTQTGKIDITAKYAAPTVNEVKAIVFADVKNVPFGKVQFATADANYEYVISEGIPAANAEWKPLSTEAFDAEKDDTIYFRKAAEVDGENTIIEASDASEAIVTVSDVQIGTKKDPLTGTASVKKSEGELLKKGIVLTAELEGEESLSYAWYRSDSKYTQGENYGTVIESATSKILTLTTADEGKYIVVVITSESKEGAVVACTDSAVLKTFAFEGDGASLTKAEESNAYTASVPNNEGIEEVTYTFYYGDSATVTDVSSLTLIGDSGKIDETEKNKITLTDSALNTKYLYVQISADGYAPELVSYANQITGISSGADQTGE